MRVQGEGRLCKKPFSLACSFFTVFLHEQKDGAPQGASFVSGRTFRTRYVHEILRRCAPQNDKWGRWRMGRAVLRAERGQEREILLDRERRER